MTIAACFSARRQPLRQDTPAVEDGGGLLLGTVTGYLAYRAMRAIDDVVIEVPISLALAMGTDALAGRLHASGPLPVVAGSRLAPSMPDDPAKPTLLAATSAAVLFSVVVQGGTSGGGVRRTVKAGRAGDPTGAGRVAPGI